MERPTITRAEATAAGLTRYFTGKSCKNGHIAERYTAGSCVECCRDRFERNTEKFKDYGATWRAENRDKIKSWYIKKRSCDPEYFRSKSRVYREKKLNEDPDYFKRVNRENYKSRIEYFQSHQRRKTAARREKAAAELANASDRLARLDRLFDNLGRFATHRQVVFICEKVRKKTAKERRKEDPAAMQAWLEDRRQKDRARREANRTVKPKRITLAELKLIDPVSYRAKKREKERRKRLANPEHYRQQRAAIAHRRRARMRGAKATLSASELSDLRAKYGKRCAICGVKGKMTIDHIIPLAAGGSHEARNIQFLCSPCNSHKRDLPMEDFARSRGLLL